MLEELKKRVWEANLLLPKYNLVIFTWGNVSGIDREKGLMVIKPSGVEYDDLRPEDMVTVDVATGEKVEGDLNPSSDTLTHAALYRAFPEIGGVVHTHSRWATVYSQAGRPIPALGTTHGDYFYGEIPVTRNMTPEEIGGGPGHYEAETGKVIVERFRGLEPLAVPGVLVAGHAPFTWGKDPQDAVDHAVALEAIARMARLTEQIHAAQSAPGLVPYVGEKHYQRKHGKNAYYGQR